MIPTEALFDFTRVATVCYVMLGMIAFLAPRR